MRDIIIRALRHEQITIEYDIMVELLVAPLLEVIDDRYFRWIELNHELCWDRGHERAA